MTLQYVLTKTPTRKTLTIVDNGHVWIATDDHPQWNTILGSVQRGESPRFWFTLPQRVADSFTHQGTPAQVLGNRVTVNGTTLHPGIVSLSTHTTVVDTTPDGTLTTMGHDMDTVLPALHALYTRIAEHHTTAMLNTLFGWCESQHTFFLTPQGHLVFFPRHTTFHHTSETNQKTALLSLPHTDTALYTLTIPYRHDTGAETYQWNNIAPPHRTSTASPVHEDKGTHLTIWVTPGTHITSIPTPTDVAFELSSQSPPTTRTDTGGHIVCAADPRYLRTRNTPHGTTLISTVHTVLAVEPTLELFSPTNLPAGLSHTAPPASPSLVG